MKKICLFFAVLYSLTLPTTAFAKYEPEQEEPVDNSIVIDRITNEDIEVSISSPVFTFMDKEVKLTFKNPNHTKLLLNKNKVEFIVNGENKELKFDNGVATFTHRFDTGNTITIYTEDFSYSATVTAYPLWAIMVPILLIIAWLIIRMLKRNQGH
jgi:hypothetical protein